MQRYYVYIMASKSRFSTSGSRTTSGGEPGSTRTIRFRDSQAGIVSIALYTLKASGTSGTPSRERKISRVGCGRSKVALIRSTNPTWEDLSESWFDEKTAMHTKLDAKMTEKQVLRSAQDDKY
jgi:hypothetical protein